MTIALLILDVDGVLTDGRLWYGPDGEYIKCFHVHDGAGLKRLMNAGVKVAIISGRDCLAARARLAELGITQTYWGVSDKCAAYDDLKLNLGIDDNQIAYMGDDLPDMPVMQQVAFPIAVANAQPEVLSIASWVTTKEGGHGAVREACEHLLATQGLSP